MGVYAEIDTIIKNLGKNIRFLQPTYEAIYNSLEADATDIVIEFFHDETIGEITPKITGFKITDNGDGFTQKNIDAFNTL